MKYVQGEEITSLQQSLNDLVKDADVLTESIPELYTLSKQLDELIVAYYKTDKKEEMQ
jgi:hypothetical protein